MDIRRTLIPYHFEQKWDIIPNRVGEWEIIHGLELSTRLAMVKALSPDIVVSGDCMAAIGAQRNNLNLVWMDAHGDFNTNMTTKTGSLGGMVFAMLCGIGDQSLMQCCNTIPVNFPIHLGGSVNFPIHLGGSEFDFGEKSLMKRVRVKVATNTTEIEYWVNFIKSSRVRDTHLHIDTDVICSEDLPSSIHPAPMGMRLDYFWGVVHKLLPVTKVLSIKTYDPRKDASGIGQDIVLTLIKEFEECLMKA